MNLASPSVVSQPIDLSYEADLLGNIQQALSGLQGFDVMALELIQNADDAGADTMIFDVRDDALVVSNNKSFTTCGLQARRCPWESGGSPDGISRPCNFHAISRMGTRSKIQGGDQIGRFGIGFVSVYQVTDMPIIQSSGVRMRLDPLNSAAPTEPTADIEGTEFTLPWAFAASETRAALNASPAPADVAKLVTEAVSAVLLRGLFFLRRLRRVELRRNGSLIRAAGIHREKGFVTLRTEPDECTKRWRLLTRSADAMAAERNIFSDFAILSELDRSTEVNVAVPLFSDTTVGLLYAFLPTEQPSKLPVHINGDFFPHSNRRSIVLTGESHERYWNELLLATAATAIGESLPELRDLLGGVRFWELGRAAFELRESPGFNPFWEIFRDAAKKSESVWTVEEQWERPATCVVAPEKMAEPEQFALESLGLSILHRDLRQFSNVLASIGVQQLRLQRVVEVLEQHGDETEILIDDPHLRPLWSAINHLLGVALQGPRFGPVLERLKCVTFLIDSDGSPANINSLYRPPADVDTAILKSLIPDCPLVHPDVSAHDDVYEEIDVLTLDDVATFLADTIDDDIAAAAIIGTDQKTLTRFYDLMTAFQVDPTSSRAGKILWNTPILRTNDGFIAPSRGQLPGGFVDPIGHFQLIDATLMSEAMRGFAERVLGVDVLTFDVYIQDHLEEILSSEPSREKYRALLKEIVDHVQDLDSTTLKVLAAISFVRTRAGDYARPEECYFWSADLEALLGSKDEYWVDETWMPATSIGRRFRDLLEDELGMRRTVAVCHLVDRLDEINNPKEGKKAIEAIVRNLLSRLPKLNPTEHQELERLKSIEFVPGQINGESIEDELFAPSDVFRSFRATGFDSQVPIVDLAPLRIGSPVVTEFLNLLDVPSEPPTDKVVAHLEHHIAEGKAAPDATYAILSERLSAPDASVIDRLRGKDFIFDADSENYLPANVVFWEAPPLECWRKASSKMVQREDLFRRLGVQDVPGADHYAALTADIARHANPSPEDIAIHARCLAWLADALEQGSLDAVKAIDDLSCGYVLLARNGTPVWSEEAVWVDSEWLAGPFGMELDGRLVSPPSVARTAAARLFKQLGVPPLSDIACQRLALASDPRPAPDATERLIERIDLLLWLPPTSDFRAAFENVLSKCEVRLSSSLMVRAEITEFDPPVSSPAAHAEAFFDSDTSVLHIRAQPGQLPDWSAAFRAIFFQLDTFTNGLDMRPIVMTAAFVISLPTRSDAEQALRNSDYQPPKQEDDIGGGGEVQDAEENEDTTSLEGDDLEAEEILPDDVPRSSRDEIGEAGADEPTDDSLGAVSDATPPRINHARGAHENASGLLSPKPKAEIGDDHRSHTSSGTEGDDPFKSKAAEPFGAASNDAPGDRRSAIRHEEGETTSGTGQQPSRGGKRNRETRAERQARRSRMLTYVAAASDSSVSEPQANSHEQVSDLIDAAAIAAVLKYERARGWQPEEQPHGNPGYDVVSRSEDGSARRLIEVKGLANEWTQRGVKLSHIQYGMAKNHPEEFWIYVVEHARDLNRQKVSAIANPFGKVEEYWFDNNWQQLSEENASAKDLNIWIGGQVKHEVWGRGTIIAVSHHGLLPSLTIDFGPVEGKRAIPYSASTLEFVD